MRELNADETEAQILSPRPNPPRRRSHPALGSRVFAAGLSIGALFGLVWTMAETDPVTVTTAAAGSSSDRSSETIFGSKATTVTLPTTGPPPTDGPAATTTPGAPATAAPTTEVQQFDESGKPVATPTTKPGSGTARPGTTAAGGAPVNSVGGQNPAAPGAGAPSAPAPGPGPTAAPTTAPPTAPPTTSVPTTTEPEDPPPPPDPCGATQC